MSAIKKAWADITSYVATYRPYALSSQKNEELLEKYGEAVGVCRQLARSHGRISEIHGEMVETYKILSKEYGLMAMNLGYALGSYAQISAR